MIGTNQTRRLLRYRMGLMRLKKMGLQKVFSYTIGEETGVSAELVRKDFSQLGIKGRRRGGYSIDELLRSLSKILGSGKVQNVILVGLGNIGAAMAKYEGFKSNNMNLVAGFDIDPTKQNKKMDIPVYPMENIDEVIDAFDVSVAVLSVPEFSAQEVTSFLVEKGI